MQSRKLINITLLSALVVFISCKKNWLDAKPDKSLAVPGTIADYQGMLDNTSDISVGAVFNDQQPTLDEISADDYYVKTPDWISLTISSRIIGKNCYIWEPDIYEGSTPGDHLDWEYPYRRIYYTNLVLEGIEKIVPVTSSDQRDWKQVKGGALFLRAYSHYTVAQIFCKSYTKATANNDLGIPLRVQSDINIPSVRSSVSQTYMQIIDDLKSASSLLPLTAPVNDVYRCRPTRAAAFAMLARVYLSMEDYENAMASADSSLSLYNTLMDYNTPNVIRRFNPEVLFQNRQIGHIILLQNRRIVDSVLFSSYDNNDLRKTIFFRRNPTTGEQSFYGSYDGIGMTPFSGLATDELFLIRAECRARLGNIPGAMQDLNTLLRKRWRTGTFIDYSETDSERALRLVLDERRKELCFRGLRWTDLRRLNKDPRFVKTVTRIINGTIYTLEPNSIYYVLPFPPEVIELSGMEQNPR